LSTGLTIDEEDQTMFCGSQSGDVLHVDLASKNFLALGPKKRFNQGVTAIAINPKTQEVLCGSGGEEVTRVRVRVRVRVPVSGFGVGVGLRVRVSSAARAARR